MIAGSDNKRRKIVDLVVVVMLLLFGVAAFVIVLAIVQQKDDAVVVDATKKSVQNRTPALDVSVVTRGLNHPWEVVFLPDKTMLITERSGDISVVKDGKKTILHHPADVYARGEGGMLGLAVDTDFVSNRYIYACFNSTLPGLDIRVARWKVDAAATSLIDRKDIITGIPSSVSGRHSGCRLGFGPDGNLWIGTGDAAQGANPQNLRNLGGKILRVDREGKGVAGNLGDSADARIYSYGHRNTQGLAFYETPRDGSYGVSVEHGSTVDDEVNPLSKGNFGWSPGLPYRENVPMTDLVRFPQAIKSIWSSGSPTIATGDADFLVGEKWGKWQGRLAMAVLKDKHLRLLELKDDSTTGEQLKLFENQFGRLRAVTMGPDGQLYLTTDNGGSADVVLKITPDLF